MTLHVNQAPLGEQPPGLATCQSRKGREAEDTGSSVAPGLAITQRNLGWKLAARLALEVGHSLGAAKEVLHDEMVALESAALGATGDRPSYGDAGWLANHLASRPRSAFTTAIQHIPAAWERADFGRDLGDAIASAKSWPAEVARQCGCTLTRLQFWLRHPGVTGLDRQTARALDEFLGSAGRLLASHTCCNQDGAFEEERPIKDSLAGGMSFGRWLREKRTKKGFSPKQLTEALANQFGVKLTPGELNQYELDYFVPSLVKRPVIESIDKILGLGGTLTATWADQQPQQRMPGCSLPAATWPADLRGEMDKLLAHTRGRPHHRWQDTQVRMFEDFCAGFFGYLVHRKLVPAPNLTLALLCDWQLVEGYWHWRTERNHRPDFTTYEVTRTRTILALYRDYFPSQWKSMTGTEYWRGRLPEEAALLGPGPARRQKIRLEGEREQWCHVVATSAGAACAFLKKNKVEGVPRNQRADGVLGKGLHLILSQLRMRAHKLPPVILSRKAALRCRRLLVAGLLLARPMMGMRTLTTLELEHVPLRENGVVELDVPGELLRHPVLKEGIKGPLPDAWDWLHEVAIRWITEARPFLLSGAAAPSARLFCEAPSGRTRKAGCKAQALDGLATSLYRDVVHLLGVNPDSVRFLVAQDALDRRRSIHDVAKLLGTSRDHASRILEQLKQGSAGRNANATVVKLTQRRGKTP